MDASDAIAFLMAGASAVQVGTATFIDPFAIPKVIKGLDVYMTSHAIADVGQIRGTARAQNRAL